MIARSQPQPQPCLQSQITVSSSRFGASSPDPCYPPSCFPPGPPCFPSLAAGTTLPIIRLLPRNHSARAGLAEQQCMPCLPNLGGGQLKPDGIYLSWPHSGIGNRHGNDIGNRNDNRIGITASKRGSMTLSGQMIRARFGVIKRRKGKHKVRYHRAASGKLKVRRYRAGNSERLWRAGDFWPTIKDNGKVAGASRWYPARSWR